MVTPQEVVVRRLVPGFVLAFVVAAVSVVLTQVPAHACTCTDSNLNQNVERADAVFTGTVSSIQRPPDENARVIMILAEVDRRWRGNVPAKVELTTPSTAAACGVGNLKADKKYLFFAQSDSAKLTIDSCGGTTAFTAELGNDVTKLLGEAKDPVTAGEPPTDPPDPPAADREVIDDSEPIGFMRIAAPGGALIIVGVLGLLMLRPFSRARQDR
jgi:hypothetical protein